MPALSLLNGRLSPLENSTLTNDDAQYDSESDSILSEVANPIVDEPSPAPSRNHQSEFGAQDSESSAAEVQDESDDADFDMEDTPAPTAPHLARQDRSTSAESRRPAKRKLDLEDEHILANPELYGLRRSVRYCRWWVCKNCIADILHRPAQSNTAQSYVNSKLLRDCIMLGLTTPRSNQMTTRTMTPILMSSLLIGRNEESQSDHSHVRYHRFFS
jgi:hypothetical protein